MDRRHSKILLAVSISIFLHGVFFAWSRHLVMPGMGAMEDRTKKIFRIKDVDNTPEAIALFRETEKTAPPSARPDSEKITEEIALEHSEALEQQEKALKTKKKKNMLDNSREPVESAKENPAPEDLLKPSEKRIQETARPEARALVEVVLAKGPSSVAEAPKINFEEPGYEGREVLQNEKEGISFEGEGRMEVEAGWGEEDAVKKVERVGKYEDMASYLEATLQTFKNKATGEKFFSVHVGVKKGIRIEAMPKEIVFLMDSSKSVTGLRFENAKKGLIEILGKLGEKDSFNIVSFKNEINRFSGYSVRATPEKITEARAFIGTLEAGERTDIETALLGIVSEKPRKKPAYVLLVSDGRPTLGMINSRKIIQTITRINSGERSIFSFGVGLRVNKYLLDFVSCQNRAWSGFANASDSAGRDLVKMYAEIASPIMTDVRYRMSGMGQKEVFPRELPDFFHSKGITIYGKYGDEDVFSMQVLGEVDGAVKEIIFKKKLSEADPGTEDIERSWAFNKLYDLVGKDTMEETAGGHFTEEIRQLSGRYGIKLPEADSGGK